MASKPVRNRLLPYKILVILLYGNTQFLCREGKYLQVKLGPFSRHLRITSSRLRDALEWLQERGLVSDLSLKYGEATLEPVTPRNLPNEKE